MVNRRFGTQFDVTSGNVNSGTAGCNEGELLIGGGFGGSINDGCTVTAADFDGDRGDWFIAVRRAMGSTAIAVSPIAFHLAIE